MHLIGRSNILKSAARLLALTSAATQCACRAERKAVGNPPSQTTTAPAKVSAVASTQPGALVLPAFIVADEEVELYAKTSGYVSMLSVDIGSRVRRDDTLIQIDVPELTDELHHAEATLAAKRARAKQAQLLTESARAESQQYSAELDLANITLARKGELLQGKAIPPQEYDVAKNGADLANARLAAARAKVAAAEGESAAATADAAVAESDLGRIKTLIGYTTIKAPFDGVVTHRGVDHGTFVRSAAQGAAASMLTIAKTDVLKVVIDIPEAETSRVSVGAPVRIEIRQDSSAPLHAIITRMAQAIRADTRTMRAEINLANSDGQRMPGMSGSVVM